MGPNDLARREKMLRWGFAVVVIAFGLAQLLTFRMTRQSVDQRPSAVFFVDSSGPSPTVVKASTVDAYTLDPSELRRLRFDPTTAPDDTCTLAVGAFRDPWNDARWRFLWFDLARHQRNWFEDPDAPGALTSHPIPPIEWASVREAIRAYLEAIVATNGDPSASDIDPAMARVLLFELDQPAYRWRPEWRGVASLICWVTLAGSAALLQVFIWRVERAQRWRAAGACTECGYDLKAVEGPCPECGAPGAAAGG